MAQYMVNLNAAQWSAVVHFLEAAGSQPYDMLEPHVSRDARYLNERIRKQISLQNGVLDDDPYGYEEEME